MKYRIYTISLGKVINGAACYWFIVRCNKWHWLFNRWRYCGSFDTYDEAMDFLKTNPKPYKGKKEELIYP